MKKLHNICNKMNSIHHLKFINLGLMVILMTCMCIGLIGCGKDSSKNIQDGDYVANVTLSGGSGRATVESPAKIHVEDGTIYATIVWSSPNYDYMLVDDQKYLNEALNGENSTFTIPIAGFDQEIKVIGDTLAMSVPHEIEYTLVFTLTELEFSAIEWQEEMANSYATQFSIQKNKDYTMITIVDSGRILLVKEKSVVPSKLPKDVTVVKEPLDNIYLVSSSVVDLIRELDGFSKVSLLGIKEEDLYIEEAKEALEKGEILYAGKYSAPDYELILSQNCDLAIENTMIYHNPETKEKLEELGIPVLVERSSYEEHPLGRLEWIKVYGALLGKEEEASLFFEKEIKRAEGYLNSEKNGLKIAYFYVNSNGAVNVRKPGDYIAKMIELSGAEYALYGIGVEEENALSTMNMQMEDFYVAAKDADILIYNSTIDGEITSIQDLIGKNQLFADFYAVNQGQVYCTSKNFFQESTGLVNFLEDLCKLPDKEETFTYLVLLD